VIVIALLWRVFYPAFVYSFSYKKLLMDLHENYTTVESWDSESPLNFESHLYLDPDLGILKEFLPL